MYWYVVECQQVLHMGFLALAHFENSKWYPDWYPDLWFVAGTPTETENTLLHFWVTSLVVSSVSDIRKLNHINCKKRNSKVKKTYVQFAVVTVCTTAQRLLGLTYILAWQKGVWGGGAGVRGSLNIVVEIAAWDMWYMWTQFLFSSSLSQTMTPWLQPIQATFCHLGSKGHWYLHQVLQSMKDGKQAIPVDRMLHNRSLDSQLKGEPSWTGSLDYTNWQLSCLMLSYHCWC